MRHEPAPESPWRGLRLFGWAALLLGLPLAFLAASVAPNRYEAMLGLDALDCDGPVRVYALAAPVLLFYATGFAVTLRGRSRRDAAVAFLCLFVCTWVATNVVRAVLTERRQAVACDAR